ncbi:hypothetical protein JYT48_03245 [Mariprofundus ferrooxydans]|nr:hypothetical protein [Mariprofundus ferrooxydans]
MLNVRLPVAVCSAVAEVLNGSHYALNALFETAGAPGPPPDLAHHSKWKIWLQRVGNDPEVDSLAVLGNLIEEFMDLPPLENDGALDDFLGIDTDPVKEYNKQKERLISILELKFHCFFMACDGALAQDLRKSVLERFMPV